MAQPKQQQTYSLARYRAEAKKEPFELALDGDKTLTIKPPKGSTLLELDGIYTTDGILKKLAGEQYDEVLEAVGDEDGSVLLAIMKDMQKHFGLGG